MQFLFIWVLKAPLLQTDCVCCVVSKKQSKGFPTAQDFIHKRDLPVDWYLLYDAYPTLNASGDLVYLRNGSYSKWCGRSNGFAIVLVYHTELIYLNGSARPSPSVCSIMHNAQCSSSTWYNIKNYNESDG
uniref:Putative secreted protein n=1 Tax=Anopheles marajoara TaxID=58244 RepID=A0A2M4C6X5_9DIPT